MTAAAGLADTSIFIGQEQQRPFREDVPAMLAVSYITVAELTLGVLNAAPANRASRLDTLIRVRQFDPLPVDDRVAVAWAELRRALRERGRRLVGNDAWIAATAIAHGLPIVTQDGDYQDLPGLTVIRV
jgi:predicted nucleic acid-binding protein